MKRGRGVIGTLDVHVGAGAQLGATCAGNLSFAVIGPESARTKRPTSAGFAVTNSCSTPDIPRRIKLVLAVIALNLAPPPSPSPKLAKG